MSPEPDMLFVLIAKSTVRTLDMTETPTVDHPQSL